jgi:hypothetical protein
MILFLFIAKRIVQALIEQDKNPGKSKVLVMASL